MESYLILCNPLLCRVSSLGKLHMGASPWPIKAGTFERHIGLN